MGLIVIIGAQASGKMTVGKELANQIPGKLLFNHQTLDLFANYLGYTPVAFKLSDQTRKELFKAFVANPEQNVTEQIIFTVVIDFNERTDVAFLSDITQIFRQAQQDVYFVELITELEERMKRNVHPDRLQAKPSKRDIDFSMNELLMTAKNNRLESNPGEVEQLFPDIPYCRILNTNLSPNDVCQVIINQFQLGN
ncbi:hypothetical protein CBF34_05320 [Vagococcus penaei]|uniref:Uncharacterized protein n=1 Tax=Vagococcus penaei TaxID=633807 RepID=A0A1Q2D6E9_9ENTE|nr:AAA family ATPase [Vagococcus penaei]AQP53894.1 hypothetical protein BW732_06465 [Vagococcus penaei]RSU02942.1 hypothetical protein CBF34_05320 [Vagococcus penaei]